MDPGNPNLIFILKVYVGNLGRFRVEKWTVQSDPWDWDRNSVVVGKSKVDYFKLNCRRERHDLTVNKSRVK